MDMISTMSMVCAGSLMAGLSINAWLVWHVERRQIRGSFPFGKLRVRMTTQRGDGCSVASSLFLLEEDGGVEEVGGEGSVVDDLGDVALVGHLSVVVSGDGHGRGQDLDGVVVVVLLGLLVEVLELRVAPLEGSADGQVSGGVEF